MHDLQSLKVPGNEPFSVSAAERTIISQNVELANEIKEIKTGIAHRSKINMNKLFYQVARK